MSRAVMCLRGVWAAGKKSSVVGTLNSKPSAGAIHRADVARLAIDVLYSKKLTKKIVTAIDPSLAEAPAAYAAAEI